MWKIKVQKIFNFIYLFILIFIIILNFIIYKLYIYNIVLTSWFDHG